MVHSLLTLQSSGFAKPLLIKAISGVHFAVLPKIKLQQPPPTHPGKKDAFAGLAIIKCKIVLCMWKVFRCSQEALPELESHSDRYRN